MYAWPYQLPPLHGVCSTKRDPYLLGTLETLRRCASMTTAVGDTHWSVVSVAVRVGGSAHASRPRQGTQKTFQLGVSQMNFLSRAVSGPEAAAAGARRPAQAAVSGRAQGVGAAAHGPHGAGELRHAEHDDNTRYHRPGRVVGAVPVQISYMQQLAAGDSATLPRPNRQGAGSGNGGFERCWRKLQAQ